MILEITRGTKARLQKYFGGITHAIINIVTQSITVVKTPISFNFNTPITRTFLMRSDITRSIGFNNEITRVFNFRSDAE